MNVRSNKQMICNMTNVSYFKYVNCSLMCWCNFVKQDDEYFKAIASLN